MKAEHTGFPISAGVCVALKTKTLALWVGLAGAAVAAAAIAQPQTNAEGQVANPRAQAQQRMAAMREKGETLFKARCASCHDPAVERAPSKGQLAGRWPEEVVSALTTGSMTAMAAGMSEDDKVAVAAFLTGRTPEAETAGPPPDPPACAAPAPRFSLAGPGWNGWSIDPKNSRHQPNPGLAAADVPRLKVKWAMTVSGGRYGQPTIAGGQVFLPTGSGRVYALDARTGCLRWRFEAPTGVRTTVVLSALAGAPSGYAAYFGDYQRNVYAVDAASGKLIWKTNVEAHPRGVLTGTPVFFQGRLHVPLSSWEETVADAANYECCTFRGGLVALDAKAGKQVWKTYVIDEAPKPHGKNPAGTTMYGPAGAAVWSAPTFDAKRGAVYVATGDSYTDVKEDASDAIVAMDIKTGKIRWKNQITEDDNYLVGCSPQRRAMNCPTKVGPDHDFGASPILFTLPGGKDVLLVGQKSGEVLALDPDARGKILWRNKVGAGSPLGGIEWGMASDGTRLYVANADTIGRPPEAKPGLFALDPATGRTLWSAPAPKKPCGWPGGGGRCVNAQSAAPTSIPGLVLAATMDGHLRAYESATGKIVWELDTGGGRYETVNGVADQTGGAIDVGGPTLAGGMLYQVSGNNNGGGPRNVLLALSVDGK
jgi:polyvinyl alcohol dehydrogenase (cytochrome)